MELTIKNHIKFIVKTYINHIKGHDYLYAYDSLFIARGKTVNKTKSLGRIDSSKDVSKKKEDFRKYLLQEEKKLRTNYWKKHIKDPTFLKYVSIEKLESLRAQLYRNKADMGSIANSAMETAFLVDFVYNSNKIEGSKVPKKSIENRIRNKTKARNDEVDNTLKAIYHVDKKFTFGLRGIEKLHQILLAHEPSNLGYRNERVIVGNEEVADWKNIQPRLKTLIEWYKKANKTWYPPHLAFEFYYRFERIHPFLDGNGRTGRLIMNRILKQHRYHPIIIWNKRKESHNTVFKAYQKGKSQAYFKFMAEQFTKTHEVYIEKIQRAFNLQKQLNYFLKPSGYNSEN